MRSVLIAGGAGFLGSHLCDRFVADRWSVIAVDNLITGRHPNIAHLLHHDQFSFAEHDVMEPFDPGGAFDAVLNFASPASVPDFERCPLEALPVSSLGTGNLGSISKRV